MTVTEKNRHALFAFIDPAINRIVGGTHVLLVILMTAMGLIMGANIVMRFCFDMPITWSNVISRYAYIYIVLLGTAISYIEGGHATIDVVYHACPKGLQRVFDVAHLVVMMALCLILIVNGFSHVATMWAVKSPVIPWLSIGVVYLSVPICALIMVPYLLQRLLLLINGKKG